MSPVDLREQPALHERRAERDPRRWFVLAVMSVGTLIVFLDNTVINTALPNISTELSATTSQLQWVIDSYVLILAGLLLLGGTIGDRFGRKRWMNVGLAVFAVGSAVGGLSADISTLIIARGIQGLGAAFVLPATLSIITNVFDRDERPKAIAVWSAVGGMGIGLGPAVGGYLVDRWDYAAAFWIHLPILGAAALGMLWVSESRDERQVGLDIPGAATGTVAIAAFVYGVIQGGEAGWTSPEIITAFAVAAVSAGAFVAIELRAGFPMLPLHFFRRPDFTGSVLALGIMFFAGIVTFFFLTQFFQLVQGRDPFETGLLVLPNALAVGAASGIAQVTLPRMGPRRLVAISLTIMATSIALLTRFDADTGTWSAVFHIALFGFGFGLGVQPMTDSVMASVPVEDAGIGSAVNDVSRELGSALGVAIVGAFVSGLYRSNVGEELDGVLPDEVVELAGEGLGVAGLAAQQLEPSQAATLVDGANRAFVDAMTAGFWFSAACLAAGVVMVLTLVPASSRTDQVAREPAR